MDAATSATSARAAQASTASSSGENITMAARVAAECGACWGQSCETRRVHASTTPTIACRMNCNYDDNLHRSNTHTHTRTNSHLLMELKQQVSERTDSAQRRGLNFTSNVAAATAAAATVLCNVAARSVKFGAEWLPSFVRRHRLLATT